MTDPRNQLGDTVATVAQSIVDKLAENPLPGKGSYPLAEVLQVLRNAQDKLNRALAAYPRTLVFAADGKRDQLNRPLAELLATLARVLVTYHGLDDVPDSVVRNTLHKDLLALRGNAHGALGAATSEMQ
jgi:hypothetical protein